MTHHLKLKTATGTYTFTREECAEQLADFDLYCMADNAAGWLVKSAIVREGMDLAAALDRARDYLEHGHPDTIDVSY